MRIIELRIENFLSFGCSDNISLEKCGLTLIDGENRDDPSARSNGAGKSTIVEALVWCLYGITLRGYEGDDVINRQVGDNCLVSVVLREDDKTWVVTRTRRHHTYKTGLRLFHGVDDISGPSVAATQEMIDKLLGMTAVSFLNSVVFGQSDAYRFSTLTDRQQKEVFDEMLGLAQYTRAYEQARDESRTLRTNVETLTREQARVWADITEAQREVRDFEERAENFVRDRTARAEKQRTRIAEVVKRINAVKEVEPEEIRSRVEDVKASVASVETRIKERMKVILNWTSTLAKLEGVKEQLAKTIARYTKLDGECPTCGQEVTAAMKEAHLAELMPKLVGAEQSILDGRAEQQAVEEAQAADERNLARLRRNLATIESELATAEASRGLLPTLCTERDRLREQLAAIRSEESPYAELLDRARRRLKSLRSEHKRIQEELASNKLKLSYYDFWIEAFGAKGVRSLLIDTALPLLNTKAQEYAQTLTDGAFTIEFKTQSSLKSGKTVERFEVNVTNAHGAASYRGCSAGERAKVDLIVGLALQALVGVRGSGVNVVFFDEPFEGLDDTAVDRVATLLSDAFAAYESVFVITHNEVLKSYFPNVWTIIKEGSISRVA